MRTNGDLGRQSEKTFIIAISYSLLKIPKELLYLTIPLKNN